MQQTRYEDGPDTDKINACSIGYSTYTQHTHNWPKLETIIYTGEGGGRGRGGGGGAGEGGRGLKKPPPSPRTDVENY